MRKHPSTSSQYIECEVRLLFEECDAVDYGLTFQTMCVIHIHNLLNGFFSIMSQHPFPDSKSAVIPYLPNNDVDMSAMNAEWMFIIEYERTQRLDYQCV